MIEERCFVVPSEKQSTQLLITQMASSAQGTDGGEKDPRLLTTSTGLLGSGEEEGDVRGGEKLEFQELENDSGSGPG